MTHDPTQDGTPARGAQRARFPQMLSGFMQKGTKQDTKKPERKEEDSATAEAGVSPQFPATPTPARENLLALIGIGPASVSLQIQALTDGSSSLDEASAIGPPAENPPSAQNPGSTAAAPTDAADLPSALTQSLSPIMPDALPSSGEPAVAPPVEEPGAAPAAERGPKAPPAVPNPVPLAAALRDAALPDGAEQDNPAPGNSHPDPSVAVAQTPSNSLPSAPSMMRVPPPSAPSSANASGPADTPPQSLPPTGSTPESAGVASPAASDLASRQSPWSIRASFEPTGTDPAAGAETKASQRVTPGNPAPTVPAKPTTLAFGARLTPLPPQSDPRAPVPLRPALPAVAAAPDANPAVSSPDAETPPVSPTNADQRVPVPPRPSPREIDPDAGKLRPAAEAAPVNSTADSTQTAPSIPSAPAPPARPGPAAPSAPLETHRVAVGTFTPTDPAKALSTAHDIRLQVNGAEQRVDIQLTERGGEVQVAVRTPDSRLAGALREDLPALSARLEQTGFRTETWLPTASAAEHRIRTVETRFSGASQNGQEPGRQGGQEQHQESQRQPHQPETESADSPPKEFSWLLSSLR